MDHEQLAALIRERGVVEMAQIVADFGRQFRAAMELGWDLTRWRVAQTAGTVLFHRVHPEHRAGDLPVLDTIRGGLYSDEPRLLCVNAPESARAYWEGELLRWTLEDLEAYGDTVLLLTPIEAPSW
jgi:hypothetical protein